MGKWLRSSRPTVVRSACDHWLTGPRGVAAQSMDAIKTPISPPSRKRSSVCFERALFICQARASAHALQLTGCVVGDRGSASPPPVRPSGCVVRVLNPAEMRQDLPLVELEESLLF